MKAPTKINFGHFLEAFPDIDLPVTLTEDSAVAFSRENGTLSTHLIEQFVLLIEQEARVDELTEFVPCLKIPHTNEFFAVIYWRAELMSYQYVLATFLKNGELIDRRVIAGTYSDGEVLLQSVATIEEDWIIYVVSGKKKANATAYDASTSTSFSLEILPTGEIIRSEDE